MFALSNTSPNDLLCYTLSMSRNSERNGPCAGGLRLKEWKWFSSEAYLRISQWVNTADRKKKKIKSIRMVAAPVQPMVSLGKGEVGYLIINLTAITSVQCPQEVEWNTNVSQRWYFLIWHQNFYQKKKQKSVICIKAKHREKTTENLNQWCNHWRVRTWCVIHNLNRCGCWINLLVALYPESSYKLAPGR